MLLNESVIISQDLDECSGKPAFVGVLSETRGLASGVVPDGAARRAQSNKTAAWSEVVGLLYTLTPRARPL
jgi:hypothetical protein